MKRRTTVAVALMLLAAMAAFAQTKKPQTLTVYAAMFEDHASLACKAFEKATGIKTSMIHLSSGEIYARVRAEKNNPQAGIWYGGAADSYIAAKAEGLLLQYNSPVGTTQIPKNFRDPEGYWYGIYTGYLGFICNKQVLKDIGVEVPKSWADLLNPKLKGQVAVSNPASSSTAYNVVATLTQLWDEEKAFDYLKKLDGLVKQYPKSGGGPAQMACMGEIGVAIGMLHDGVKYQQQGYKDLALSAPSEGTGYEIGAVGIIKGSKEEEAAKMFVDWCLTADAQEIGQTVGSFQFLTNPDANPPKEVSFLKGTKTINYDLAWAGANRNRLVEKWHVMTGK